MPLRHPSMLPLIILKSLSHQFTVDVLDFFPTHDWILLCSKKIGGCTIIASVLYNFNHGIYMYSLIQDTTCKYKIKNFVLLFAPLLTFLDWDDWLLGLPGGRTQSHYRGWLHLDNAQDPSECQRGRRLQTGGGPASSLSSPLSSLQQRCLLIWTTRAVTGIHSGRSRWEEEEAMSRRDLHHSTTHF